MTPEYAALSLRVGYLAGMADAALNTSEFSERSRADKWEFSEEYVVALKQELRARGLSPCFIEYAESEAAAFMRTPAYAESLKRQLKIDAELGMGVTK